MNKRGHPRWPTANIDESENTVARPAFGRTDGTPRDEQWRHRGKVTKNKRNICARQNWPCILRFKEERQSVTVIANKDGEEPSTAIGRAVSISPRKHVRTARVVSSPKEKRKPRHGARGTPYGPLPRPSSASRTPSGGGFP